VNRLGEIHLSLCFQTHLTKFTPLKAAIACHAAAHYHGELSIFTIRILSAPCSAWHIFCRGAKRSLESPWFTANHSRTDAGFAKLPAILSKLRELQVNGRRPSLPDGVRIYAVGDIHARLDLLNLLLGHIYEDLAARPAARPICVFLGDYIDRGPSSHGTIDRLIEHSKAHESIFLKGNHEFIALKCLTDRSLFEQWLRLGGLETIISYGISPHLLGRNRKVVELQAALHQALPQAHFRFFRDLLTSFTCGDFFFAHAGVKPHVELSRQDEKDLLWIRDEFLSSTEDYGKIVVHGHTPTQELEVRLNRINIDTGAFATGRLTCLVVQGETLFTIDTFSAQSK
jgi:serine/threonine protein phosphatase 1